MNPSTGECDCSGFAYPDPNDNPARVDLAELKATYGALSDMYDILDVGYWLADGTYEPPCLHWREERDQMLAEDSAPLV